MEIFLNRLLSCLYMMFYLIFSLSKAQAGYSLMNDVHLSMLRGLALQAGVITATVCAMAAILPAYYTSYSNILSVFLAFIEQAGRYIRSCVSLRCVSYKYYCKHCSRIQGEDALVKMTHTAYNYFVKEYFEKDGMIFSFTLSVEVCNNVPHKH